MTHMKMATVEKDNTKIQLKVTWPLWVTLFVLFGFLAYVVKQLITPDSQSAPISDYLYTLSIWAFLLYCSVKALQGHRKFMLILAAIFAVAAVFYNFSLGLSISSWNIKYSSFSELLPSILLVQIPLALAFLQYYAYQSQALSVKAVKKSTWSTVFVFTFWLSVGYILVTTIMASVGIHSLSLGGWFVGLALAVAIFVGVSIIAKQLWAVGVALVVAVAFLTFLLWDSFNHSSLDYAFGISAYAPLTVALSWLVGYMAQLKRNRLK